VRRAVVGRAGLGLVATVALVALVLPRSLPGVDPLDPAPQAVEATEFGLRALATLLAGYLALVFLGLLLAALRLVPSSVRIFVDRWTTRGLAGGLRRCVGLSALAIGMLPIQPLAAHAAESAPVIVADDADPPATRAPRLAPVRPAAPAPTAPEPATTDPLAVEPEPVGPERPAQRPALRDVTVGPGDSFWSVAERLTSDRLGRPAADSEVLEPWLALIEANRDRLTDPDDPDLLFPGQVLRRPG
jgi:hypothetical protein